MNFYFQFFFFIFFKIIGPKLSSKISGKMFEIIGPFFRSKKVIHDNIKRALPGIDENNLKNIENLMWNNYGRIFAEYIFLKDFRYGKLASEVHIEGQDILNDIKENNKQVIFISGHLSNFELMAMSIEKSGINLSTIYRPLNNIFLNGIMENIRKRYICKNQIKKGLGGVREIIKAFSQNISIALMIDQRVTEGEKSILFKKSTYTTTIPAQLIKKYKCPVVPIYIQRSNDIFFDMSVEKPIYFSENDDVKSITLKLNNWLESKISINPDQWIWTHNKWKL